MQFHLNRLTFTTEVLQHSKWIKSLTELFLYAKLLMPYINPLIDRLSPQLESLLSPDCFLYHVTGDAE